MGFVIGTAGHIDHGKTALVKALTGQDTDRLRAEKERGISIDLGFAHFTLPNQTKVSIIDVPGHERFIRNMVAGAHGIDLVLFVVAADDGVMPQTEEHFAIVRSLGIRNALFVITKTDRATGEQIANARDELRLLTDGSKYANSPILSVSSLTGEGIGALRQAIADRMNTHDTPEIARAFRMPIDRVFSVRGRGVVITGTVLAGTVEIGKDIVVVPGDRTYRIRGLQKHGVDVDRGNSNERVAINLTGATRTDINRGDVACEPGIARATARFDVTLVAGENIPAPIRNRQRVRLHLGAAERLGTVNLLGSIAQLDAGKQGLAQIVLTEPVHAMTSDFFVIRNEQAENTLGGGRVLDPIGEKHPRRDTARLGRLSLLDAGNTLAATRLLFLPPATPAAALSGLSFRLNIAPERLAAEIKSDDHLHMLRGGLDALVTSDARLQMIAIAMAAALADHHKTHPAATGLSAEELQTRVPQEIPPAVFRAFVNRLVADGSIVRRGSVLALPGHSAGLSDAQTEIARSFLATLRAEPFSPPLPDPKNRDLQTVIAHLETKGHVRRAKGGVVFMAEAFAQATEKLDTHLALHDTITAAEFRDLLGTSRKYALALLETFDRSGRTVRVGDVRKSGKTADVD